MLRAISDADEDGEGGNPWGNPWEACVEVDQTEEDFRGWEGRWCVSTQSQGRGHGEGGGVQYQTLNSGIEELFGEEELGSNMSYKMQIFMLNIPDTFPVGRLCFGAK